MSPGSYFDISSVSFIIGKSLLAVLEHDIVYLTVRITRPLRNLAIHGAIRYGVRQTSIAVSVAVRSDLRRFAPRACNPGPTPARVLHTIPAACSSGPKVQDPTRMSPSCNPDRLLLRPKILIFLAAKALFRDSCGHNRANRQGRSPTVRANGTEAWPRSLRERGSRRLWGCMRALRLGNRVARAACEPDDQTCATLGDEGSASVGAAERRLS